MDQPKIERLLRLMKMLTGNYRYTPKELAERLDMSVRTIYRYLDTFRAAGFVLKKQDNCIRLDSSSPYFRDISELIHFTEEEAFVLKSAIESIDETHILKQNLKKKLHTIYDYKILAETTVSGKHARNIQQLINAMERRQQVLLLNYTSAHGSTVRDRLVEPFAFTTNYVQVWCYDVEEGSNKLFKCSRMHQVAIKSQDWQYSQQHKAGYIDVFRLHSDTLIPVKLKMTMRAVSLLKEEYPLSAQHITPIDKQHWLLATDVCAVQGVGRFVMGLLDEIEIVEGDELRAYIREQIAKY